MIKIFSYKNLLTALFTLVLYSSGWSQAVVNLNTHYSGTPPFGTVFEWHSGLPVSGSNLLTTAQAGAVIPGNYYGVFYDSVSNCYSPSIKVKVVTNTCPVLTVDLTQYAGSAAPSGSALEWHTSSTPSNANLVAAPNAVGNGIYWAVFHDTLNNCYSPVSSPVIVAVGPCACYKPAVAGGTLIELGTATGITSLNRASANGWPTVRKGAWLALESKTKGFVPNRLTSLQVAQIPVADLVEGMMVYNKDLDCLQINIDGTASGWKCFLTQTCPDY